MKTRNLFAASLMFAIVALTSCSKEGPAGAQGPQGPQGPQGAQGPQGVQGNANVTMYSYGSRTFTGSADYNIPNITQGKIDSSLILAYYNPSTEAETAWYPVPGLGSSAMYLTRYFIYQSIPSPSTYTMGVRLLNATGSAPYTSLVTFTKFRILIAPASAIAPGSRTAAPDFRDYYATLKYFNLQQ